MRRITIQRRLGAVLLSLLTVCVLLPARISAAQTSQVDVAYVASDSDCTATLARPAALPHPQSAFPYDVTSVCLVIRGSFQDSDSVTAVIYDSAGRVAWHSGPGTFGQWRSYSTMYPSRYRTAVQAEILFRGLQDGQLISTFWPVDRYRVDVTLNGPVVVSFTWTAGNVPPLTPTGTATPSPTAGYTPAPPSPTATTAPPTATGTPSPKPPTATPSPTATVPPATILFQGKNYTIGLPRTWAVVRLPSGLPVFFSAGRSIEIVVGVDASGARPSTPATDYKAAMDFLVAQANGTLHQHLVPSYEPFAIGSLVGSAAVAHIGHSSAGFTVAVLSDGHYAAAVVLIVFPMASRKVIKEAREAVASIQATG